MPQLMDLCSDKQSMDRLQSIYDKIRSNEKRAMEDEKKERLIRHRNTHIFNTYEQALDWLEDNPGRRIVWHAKTLSWIPEEELFLSYEQDYSYDGVIAYDVTRKYTRQELLDDIHDFIYRMQEKGYNPDELKDKLGNLGFVYKI